MDAEHPDDKHLVPKCPLCDAPQILTPKARPGDVRAKCTKCPWNAIQGETAEERAKRLNIPLPRSPPAAPASARAGDSEHCPLCGTALDVNPTAMMGEWWYRCPNPTCKWSAIRGETIEQRRTRLGLPLPPSYPPRAAPRVVEFDRPAAAEETTRVMLTPLRAPPGKNVQNENDIVDLMQGMEDFDREYLRLIYLDGSRAVLGIENVAIGTVNRMILTSREMLKGAILANAQEIVIVHNHPDADPYPSAPDKQTTKIIAVLAELLGMSVLDSVIISSKGAYSFQKAGLLQHSETRELATMMQAILGDALDPGSEKADACSLAVRAAIDTLLDYCGDDGDDLPPLQ